MTVHVPGTLMKIEDLESKGWAFATESLLEMYLSPEDLSPDQVSKLQNKARMQSQEQLIEGYSDGNIQL